VSAPADTLSHVGEIREAPEPRPVRQRDLVRFRALTKGWEAMTGEGPALSSFSSFKAGVAAYEEYMALWNRRGR